MNDKKVLCSGRTYADGRGGTYCSRRGTVKSADGRLYCKQHLPENRAAKQVAWQEKFRADWERQGQKYKADDAVNKATIHLRTAIRGKDIALVSMAAIAWDAAISKREELNCPICIGVGKIKVDDYKKVTTRIDTCPVCLGKGKLLVVDRE